MVTPVEKRDPNKYCEFHSDTGHSTDECMQLRKQIDEMIKAGKLSQFIKELKQNDKPKAPKKGEASGKDKPLTILMIQPWERVAKPRITQSFSPETAMSFPPLREEDGTEGPMIIEVDMGGHFVHRVYIDGGASSEVLYEHCFIKLRKEIRDQMVPATTHLIGFSGETIWPLGQIALLVKIGDETHSTSAWMNFMVIRSPSQHNAIIGRPGIRKIRAVPSTAHGMLKFPVEGGTVTLQRKRGAKKLCSCSNKLGYLRWKPDDMTGVPRKTSREHRLNIGRDIHRQAKRKEDRHGKNKVPRRGGKISVRWNMKEDVQKLNGKLASLNRFLSKSAEKSLPFFKTLKKCTKKSDFQWTSETEEAFRQIKKLIAELPTLTASRENEELIIYLAAVKEAISAVLMTDREGRQIPVYFVSRTLRGPEVNIPLENSEISGRMLKWKFELEGYDIQYRPRTAIKGQILADFIVERPEEESSDETHRFEATNNEAEYEALIADLRSQRTKGIKNLQANVGSRLVANKLNGSYTPKRQGMDQDLNKVKTLAKSFKEFSIKQIPRSENKKADALSKIASTSFAHLNKQVLVEELKEKSINEKEILDIVEEEGNTWMTPICEYLTKEILPEDKKKARAVRRKAARYAMINGTLYKKSFLGPWLRCVGPLQANYVLREIHEGSCSMHSGPRSVVAKVIQTGYYWPTMHMDARNLIRECSDCQIHRPVPRNPQQNLTPITSPWPFYKWGIDIAGPFPEGPGKVKFLIVAIDYFTKWIEAKAVATITGNQVKKFVWDNIVCRFGLPGEIISDNGKQFRDNPFKDWCEKLCIRQCFASVKHPQANGLVERANRSLGEGIKARLDEKSKDWIEELPHVLWAHRTMIKSSNGETPFSLTYGTEAVIPAEIGMPTLRTAEIDQTKNNEALGINLDLIEERREQAAIQEAKSKKKMEKYYNSRVRGTSFKPGDMVYRSNEASHAKDEGKLGPKWEGPYEVKESLGKGAYKLKDCKGNEMPRTWNICNLKKCYIHEM
ncbi:reverse transcriptase domain-containing protein [Tanacetum coccineum]